MAKLEPNKPHGNFKDISGHKFHRLTAIDFVERRVGRRFWRFSCICGAIAVADRDNVVAGRTKSCGCLRSEIGDKNTAKARKVLATRRIRKWTPELDKLLVNLYPKASAEELSLSFPSFSYYALKARARRLNLHRPANIFWTKDRLELLKNIYDNATILTLQNSFPEVSLNAIRTQASKFGLKRDKFATARSIGIPSHLPTNPVTLAYIAGILDGEGHIGINIVKPSFRVAIVNTNLDLIKWLSDQLGGRIRSLKKTQARHLTCYQWICTSRYNIVPLLKALSPYLIVKKTIAETCIAIINGLPRTR